jgi:hypothetical protein
MVQQIERQLTPWDVAAAATAPFANAVQRAGDRGYETAQMLAKSRLDERLQQLRMDAAYKNVMARETTLMKWHQAHDAAVLQGQAIMEKQRADAENARGEQNRTTALQKQAQGLGVSMPKMNPGESQADYNSRVSTALQPAIDKQKEGFKDSVKSDITGLTDNYNKMQGIKQIVTKQAGDMVTGTIPDWIQNQDPALVAAYNNAKAKNPTLTPQQIVQSIPQLNAAFQPYAQGRMPVAMEQIAKGYEPDIRALSLDTQNRQSHIQNFLKTNPDAGEIYSTASTEVNNEQAAKAQQDATAADLLRQKGADKQTQDAADQKADASKAASEKYNLAHQQAMDSLQQVGLIGKLKEAGGATGGAIKNVVGNITGAPSNIATDANALLFGQPTGAPTAADIAARRLQLGMGAPRIMPPNGAASVPVNTNGVAMPSTNSPAVDLHTPRYSAADVMSLMGIGAPSPEPATTAPAGAAPTVNPQAQLVPPMPDGTGQFLQTMDQMNNYQANNQLVNP